MVQILPVNVLVALIEYTLYVSGSAIWCAVLSAFIQGSWKVHKPVAGEIFYILS